MKVSIGLVPPEGWEEKPAPGLSPSFWWPVGNLRHCLALILITLISACIFMWHSLCVSSFSLFLCVCLSKVKEKWSCSVISDSLQPHGLYHHTRPLCPLNFLSKNTGVGCHAFLQGIFPTQGLSPRLLHCRQILYQWVT